MKIISLLTRWRRRRATRRAINQQMDLYRSGVLSTARCPRCSTVFTANTEREVSLRMVRHLALDHAEPPTEAEGADSRP